MRLIELYATNNAGFNPFLISDGWQIAKLNYIKDQHISNINKIEVHHQTDEAFILLKGKSVLISVEIKDEKLTFKTKIMLQNVTYNVPKNVWHNIAMVEESEVLIVEKSNTHINDVEYQELNTAQIMDLQNEVKKILN